MSANPAIERQTVYFAGRVQGVGFRYTTRRISARHQVTGFVRNLADGRVEVVAEGTRFAVTEFIRDIVKTMGGRVDSSDVHQQDGTGEFEGFDIRY